MFAAYTSGLLVKSRDCITMAFADGPERESGINRSFSEFQAEVSGEPEGFELISLSILIGTAISSPIIVERTIEEGECNVREGIARWNDY